MKYTRSELREKNMIILYQIEFYKREKMNFKIEDVIKEHIEINNDFSNNIIYGTLEKEKELITIIEKYLKDWNFKRLGLTDQAILKMSAFELLYTSTPKIVVINEAIELSKKYSDEKIPPLINGVLDNILNNEVK